MILYLDTSAFLKLFIAEPESESVETAASRAEAVATHLITYAELRAAFAKALRMGRETPETLLLHKEELDRQWKELMVLMPEQATVFRAGELAERFSLRGYDSVHLAAAEALFLRIRNRVAFRMAVYDARLGGAAKTLGLEVL
jgi:predicted nucleic acid-binding protein